MSSTDANLRLLWTLYYKLWTLYYKEGDTKTDLDCTVLSIAST